MENGPSASLSPADQPAATPDLSGRSLGDFRIIRSLGQGGMGQVYLAEQQSLKRPVALEDPARRPGGQPGLAASFSGRGRGGRPRHPRQHRAGLRHRPGRRAALHGPGIRRRPQPPRPSQPQRRPRSAAGPEHPDPGDRGAAAGGGKRHRPPRHQAGKHPADPARRGEGRRLRPVALPGRRPRAAQPDAKRRHDGHAPVHEPGAGARRRHRSAHRHLFVRRDLLPHACRRSRRSAGTPPSTWRCSTSRKSRSRWPGNGPTCPPSSAPSSTR